MKLKKFSLLAAAVLALALLPSVDVAASAAASWMDYDARIPDTGSGGTPSNNTYWSGNSKNYEGVRLTILDKQTNMAVPPSVDVANNAANLCNEVDFHFGKIDKHSYLHEMTINKQAGGYEVLASGDEIPKIMGTTSNPAAVRAYFEDPERQKYLCELTGFDYGKIEADPDRYRLLIEPIMYFHWEGPLYAATATERAMMAKNNIMADGTMPGTTLTSLPISAFLEIGDEDLGLSPPPFSMGNGRQSIDNMFQFLGMMLVKMGGDLPPLAAAAPTTMDFEFRSGTEVVLYADLVSTEGGAPKEGFAHLDQAGAEVDFKFLNAVGDQPADYKFVLGVWVILSNVL
jgi:hypothetical protein